MLYLILQHSFLESSESCPRVHILRVDCGLGELEASHLPARPPHIFSTGGVATNAGRQTQIQGYTHQDKAD